MPRLIPPTPDGFFSFLIAYFGDRVIDTRRESSHFVVVIEGLRDNISIPTNLPIISIRILAQLLRSCGIERSEYVELAGTQKKLKQFIKQQKKA